MKKHISQLIIVILICIGYSVTGYALGEIQQTVMYVTTYQGSQTPPIYTSYSIVAHAESGYWLQRTTSLQPDSGPLSITQTLLDNDTHKPLRYIMHRPANMKQPERVADLPLAEMGKDEVLPTLLTKAFKEHARIEVPAGTYDTQKGQDKNITLWLSHDIPVLGVVRAEMKDWTMELFRIDHNVIDLLPKKPPKGGIVNMNEKK
jgi:hypothetical protein